MSIGNLPTQGDKKNNFTWQKSVVELLGIIAASAGTGCCPTAATEATLLSVLAAIQQDKDFEQNLVMDLGGVGCPTNCPTYLQIRIWNGTGFNPPIYYDASGAIVVPVGPLQIVNPQYVLENILLQTTATATNTNKLDVNLSTRASEATLLATNVLLTAISGRLDVNLSTRATEATLALVNAALGTLNTTAAAQAKEATQLLVLAQLTALNGNVNVALSTRASESTLLTTNTLLTGISTSLGNLSNLDVLLSTRASEATLLTRATEATLLLIKAKTDNLDVLLSTRNAEATQLLIKAKTDNLDVLLSTRASEATLLVTNTTLSSILSRLDVNLSTRASEATLATMLTLAGFQARINTLGQKTMANSTPVVLASDQSSIPVTNTPVAATRTPSVVNVASSVAGNTTAGVQEVSLNFVGTGGTLGGVTMPNGSVVTFRADKGDTLNSIAYVAPTNASGRIIITYLT